MALSLGATAAQAQLFLPLGSFGSQGSAAGQFQTPLGVAVDQASGDVYVGDSGNARVQKFSGTGTFIAAWGYGVTDGTAVSQVCTTTCQAGIPGSGAGQFQTPSSIAVDSSGGVSAGDVYVGDSGNQVVLKFDTNGNFLATIDGTTSTQGHFSVVAGVAVDQSGNLWVADANTDNIIEFDPSGNFLQQWNDTFGTTVAIAVDATNNAVYLIRGAATTERFTLTGGGETVIDNDASCTALSVDPASGNLFVDHGSFVNIFNSSATMISSFTLSTSSSQGLAFGTTAGNVYVSDTAADKVTFYGPPTTPGPPLVFSESATNLSDTGATLNTTIVPFGLDTTCQFQYVDDADFQSTGYTTATSVPCVPPDLGSSFTFQNANATITGLTSLTLYHFRAVATNSDGTVNGADMTFQTTGPAIVVTQPATNIVATDATLNGTVNPNGLDTTCVFQIVDDTDFQQTGYATATSVPCSPSDVGTGDSPVPVSADAGGALTPATLYHFRAVATSADGTVNGNDQTFTTLIAGPPSVGGEAATSITDASATLNASVNPFGLDTTCTFQYVTDAAFQGSGYSTATSVPCNPSDVGNSFTPQSVTANLTGLTPGTTYHFRAVAVNADGTTDGTDTTFQTLVAFMVQVGSFGSPGTGASQFQTLIGVAAAGGKVYVADSGNARVQRFNQKGVFKAAWGWGVKDGKAQSEVCTNKKSCQPGIAGAGAGQFQNPTSIAVDSSKTSSKGSVYVGDAGNNVVLKFKSSGKFLATIDGTTAPQGHFVSLTGVAVDQNGNVWTVDSGTGNVDRFNSTGGFVQEFPVPSSLGSLQGPIAVDSTNGIVYLLLNGSFSGMTVSFTLSGGGGTTIDPQGGTALGLDPLSGNLYVDHGVPISGIGGSPSHIAVYDPSGAQIGILPSLGGGATNNSQGLAYFSKSKSGRNDRLYVGDASNDTVTIYGPRSAGAPFISVESATHAGLTSETLSAGIVPLGRDTTCSFQYVDSADFLINGYTNAASVPCSPADLGSSFILQTGQALVPSLTVGTFYHFHVTATNSSGTVVGPDQTFQVGPGDWTPFFRCPVDDPAMLAASSSAQPACIASNSTHGSITIGPITTLTGNTNLQFGLPGGISGTTIISPMGGAVISDPTPALGGILALVSSAGSPSNFDLFAGIGVGQPIVTLPIKIQLTGPGLGPNCFIGTDQNPIVLIPANISLAGASASFAMFDPDGTPDPNGTIGAIFVSGAVQGDSTFSVPGASGCGPAGDGSADSLVNNLLHLPSPSGSNSLVLLDASSAVAVPVGGQDGFQWSTDWHTGFGGAPPTSTTTTTISTTTTTT